MATERVNDQVEEDIEDPGADHAVDRTALSDRPGTPGYPSRAESREGADTANATSSELWEPSAPEGQPGPQKDLSEKGDSEPSAPSDLDGKRDYVVDDPTRPGRQITDIDRIEDGTLWEEKSASSAVDIDKWVSKHIDKKFDSYLEARRHLKGYENAPIGFSFSEPSADPEFRSAVENAIEELQKSHPDVTIRLEWPQ
ncbi:hypothetical protein [Actinoallomurus iriomotensis]|nr:hypothetical protein [Actinoallomurus iriomotensis]